MCSRQEFLNLENFVDYFVYDVQFDIFNLIHIFEYTYIYIGKDGRNMMRYFLFKI